jgi:hypothetical protein
VGIKGEKTIIWYGAFRKTEGRFVFLDAPTGSYTR